MSRSLDLCEHSTASGHCSVCQHEHYTKTTILENPCPNCERLELEAQQRYHDGFKVGHQCCGNEIARLKAQLAMCRSNLLKISVRCEGGMHKMDFDRIAELTAECLAKLEKE